MKGFPRLLDGELLGPLLYLPNSGQFSPNNSITPLKYYKDPILKYSTLERENSEEKQLYEMLVKRRKMKEQDQVPRLPQTRVPDTLEFEKGRLSDNLNVAQPSSKSRKEKLPEASVCEG